MKMYTDNINIKRRLLYGSYKFLKNIGYIRIKNIFKNYATILIFHRVNDFDSDPLTTPTPVFKNVVKVLRNNYKICSLQDLIMRIKNKETLDPKTVVITFDDGYKDNLLNAVPILKKYNIPATFFITSGYINTDNTLSWDKKSVVKHPLMTWDEVRELVRMGFDIGAHTVNHINLGEASLDTARKEITRCKSHIEMEIDKEINTFAFPFGKRNCIRDEVIKIIKEVGFDCCCSAYGGKVTKDTDLYNLYRIPMYPNTIELLMELDNFMIYFEGKMNINLWSLFGLFLSNIWDIEFSSQVFSLTNVL